MSEQLTNLERAVLEMMLTGENAELKILREQFSKATVSKRELTGQGFFTSLEIPAAVPRLQKKGRVTITDVSAELQELKHGAGFVLFVDDGAMNCLEGFCYDQVWPDSTVGFALSYLKESPRGSRRLIPSKERDAEFAFKDFVTEV
jgi:hypothetical protein